ncbi:MAG: hypothetical protein MJZ55_04945 [Paludibacteraceae bacterium]|nr:hypothetical protein [Paludibacteraceae bacterium]
MKATPIYPFASLHGQIRKSDRFYTRTLNGQCIIQRKPRRTTPRQQAMRRAFALKYQGRHPPASPESIPVAPP